MYVAAGPPNCFFVERFFKVSRFILTLLVLAAASALQVSAQETKVRWFGHAAFSITTPKGVVLLIDPWLKNPSNPEAQGGKDPLASVPKVDYILLTHGHRDHVGDAVEIARKTGAVLICNPELAGNLVKLADFPGKQAETDAIMGIGGEIQIADGEVTVAMTPAVHSSSVFNPKAGATEPERAYGGNPAGFVLIIRGGPTIYHSGDTAYFKDMETIGEQYRVDCPTQHRRPFRDGAAHGGEGRAIRPRRAGSPAALRHLPGHRRTCERLRRRTQAAAHTFL